MEEYNYYEIEGSDCSDDSQDDPTYDIVEETRSSFSNLSMEKNPKSRVQKEIDLGFVIDLYDGEIAAPVLDKKDEKSFEMVQKMIEDDQIEKLKVDQCKVYLRKNGLRLTGTKDTLIQRIKEHIDIINGGGEKKYPVSSFVLNCKGDACTGDVVMFEQNVYEMYNIASRSASGPPCGTRIIVGRIVKESYGAAKQQHTFTIEVLWSKGEKPLPPLHPLLIKGRNLYRLKTLRQRWEDEGERQRVLMEKHSRGSLARANREVRIQAKEMRKDKRHSKDTSKAEPKRNDFQLNPEKLVQPPTQQKQSCYQDQQWEDEWERQRVLMEKHSRGSLARANREVRIQAKEMHEDKRHSTDTSKAEPKRNDFQLNPEILVQPPTQQKQSCYQDQQWEDEWERRRVLMEKHSRGSLARANREVRIQAKEMPEDKRHSTDTSKAEPKRNNFQLNPEKLVQPPTQQKQSGYQDQHSNHHVVRPMLHSSPRRDRFFADNYSYGEPRLLSSPRRGRSFANDYSHREPSRSMSHFPPFNPQLRYYPPLAPSRNHHPPLSSSWGRTTHNQVCRHYARGRCSFGENCRFLHDLR